MVSVPFVSTDFHRGVTNSADLVLKNRYFEENPSLTQDGASLVARPGLRKFTEVGAGPIRGIESEAGSFNGDLFVVSGEELYRVSNQGTETLLFSGLANSPHGQVNMAITGIIGDTPAFAYIADGTNLYVYMENGFARNTLSGTPLPNDVVEIAGIYYKWTSGSLSDPATGSQATPYLVKHGGTPFLAYQSLYYAVNDNGAPGVDYSNGLLPNASVLCDTYTSTVLTVRAHIAGGQSNNITTTETGSGISWTTPDHLGQGGEPSVLQVMVPDEQGVIDVAVVNSYVIVIPQQDNGYQGRFYWIEPGETVIDPLNFATAERSPDGIYGVEVFGDQFWLPGESTTEVWYVTGQQDNPMQRLQGVVLDRGSWESTAVAIHETMVVVDSDGGVFLVQGGSPKRVSTPAIEEQIRNAISRQSFFE